MEVIPVHGGNDGRFAHPRLRQQRFPGTEASFFRDAEFTGGNRPPDRVRFGNRGNLMASLLRILRIDHSPLPGADQNKFHNCLRNIHM